MEPLHMSNRDYLRNYLAQAPLSLAFIRAIECRHLSGLDYQHPILDVGCGDGLFASILFREKIDVGIDVSSREISLARRRGVYEELKVASAMDIPYPDRSFATVLSNGVLEHIPEIDMALKEIARVLKVEGTLILTLPGHLLKEYFFSYTLLRKLGLRRLGEWYTKRLNRFFRHYNLHSPQTWRERMAKANLEMVSYRYYNSKPVIWLHELTLVTSFPAFLNKRLFHRWILFPKLRRWLLVPILEKCLRRYYQMETKPGASLLIVAKKR